MTDGVAVFYNVLTFLQVGQQKFVTVWNGVFQLYLITIESNDCSFLKLFQSHGHVVGLVDFNECGSHIVCLCLFLQIYAYFVISTTL